MVVLTRCLGALLVLVAAHICQGSPIVCDEECYKDALELLELLELDGSLGHRDEVPSASLTAVVKRVSAERAFFVPENEEDEESDLERLLPPLDSELIQYGHFAGPWMEDEVEGDNVEVTPVIVIDDEDLLPPRETRRSSTFISRRYRPARRYGIGKRLATSGQPDRLILLVDDDSVLSNKHHSLRPGQPLRFGKRNSISLRPGMPMRFGKRPSAQQLLRAGQLRMGKRRGPLLGPRTLGQVGKREFPMNRLLRKYLERRQMQIEANNRNQES